MGNSVDPLMGEPRRTWGPLITSKLGAGDPQHLQAFNEQPYPAVIRSMIVTCRNPADGDTFDIYWGVDSSQPGVLGGGIGTGHVGSFSTTWNGHLVVPGGFSLYIEAQTAGFGVWSWMAWGFWTGANPEVGGFSLS